MELEETVMEIIHENILRGHKKMKFKPHQRDKEKYYLFHDDQGHLT